MSSNAGDGNINLELASKKPGLVMGKQKKQLASTLDYNEKLVLKKAIQAETKIYQKQVAAKYHDEFNQSIMVDAEDTRIKNEVLRKIKFYKKKK